MLVTGNVGTGALESTGRTLGEVIENLPHRRTDESQQTDLGRLPDDGRPDLDISGVESRR